jgi:hypothetical protein
MECELQKRQRIAPLDYVVGRMKKAGKAAVDSYINTPLLFLFEVPE